MNKTTPAKEAAMRGIKAAIAAAGRKAGRIAAAANRQEAARRPVDYVELSEQTMTAGHVEQFEKVQAILAQVGALIQSVNTINVAYGLGLPPLTACEINRYRLEMDERIRRAAYSAKEMGVGEVVKKIGTVQAKQRPADNREAA